MIVQIVLVLELVFGSGPQDRVRTFETVPSIQVCIDKAAAFLATAPDAPTGYRLHAGCTVTVPDTQEN